MNRKLLGVVLLALVGNVRADVMPPGYKSISHRARFENLADYPDYVFFTAYHPRRRFGPQKKEGVFAIDAERLNPADATMSLGGNPMDGDYYLLAVPRMLIEDGGQPMSNWFDGQTPGVLQAVIGSGIRNVPELESRPELWTHFRVAIADDKLSLTKTRDDRPGDGKGDDPAGAPSNDSIRWYIGGGLALTAIALLVGWVIYFRRK